MSDTWNAGDENEDSYYGDSVEGDAAGRAAQGREARAKAAGAAANKGVRAESTEEKKVTVSHALRYFVAPRAKPESADAACVASIAASRMKSIFDGQPRGAQDVRAPKVLEQVQLTGSKATQNIRELYKGSVGLAECWMPKPGNDLRSVIEAELVLVRGEMGALMVDGGISFEASAVVVPKCMNISNFLIEFESALAGIHCTQRYEYVYAPDANLYNVQGYSNEELRDKALFAIRISNVNLMAFAMRDEEFGLTLTEGLGDPVVSISSPGFKWLAAGLPPKTAAAVAKKKLAFFDASLVTRSVDYFLQGRGLDWDSYEHKNGGVGGALLQRAFHPAFVNCWPAPEKGLRNTPVQKVRTQLIAGMFEWVQTHVKKWNEASADPKCGGIAFKVDADGEGETEYIVNLAIDKQDAIERAPEGDDAVAAGAARAMMAQLSESSEAMASSLEGLRESMNAAVAETAGLKTELSSTKEELAHMCVELSSAKAATEANTEQNRLLGIEIKDAREAGERNMAAVLLKADERSNALLTHMTSLFGQSNLITMSGKAPAGAKATRAAQQAAAKAAAAKSQKVSDERSGGLADDEMGAAQSSAGAQDAALGSIDDELGCAIARIVCEMGMSHWLPALRAAIDGWRARGKCSAAPPNPTTQVGVVNPLSNAQGLDLACGAVSALWVFPQRTARGDSVGAGPHSAGTGEEGFARCEPDIRAGSGSGIAAIAQARKDSVSLAARHGGAAAAGFVVRAAVLGLWVAVLACAWVWQMGNRLHRNYCTRWGGVTRYRTLTGGSAAASGTRLGGGRRHAQVICLRMQFAIAYLGKLGAAFLFAPTDIAHCRPQRGARLWSICLLLLASGSHACAAQEGARFHLCTDAGAISAAVVGGCCSLFATCSTGARATEWQRCTYSHVAPASGLATLDTGFAGREPQGCWRAATGAGAGRYGELAAISSGQHGHSAGGRLPAEGEEPASTSAGGGPTAIASEGTERSGGARHGCSGAGAGSGESRGAGEMGSSTWSRSDPEGRRRLDEDWRPGLAGRRQAGDGGGAGPRRGGSSNSSLGSREFDELQRAGFPSARARLDRGGLDAATIGGDHRGQVFRAIVRDQGAAHGGECQTGVRAPPRSRSLHHSRHAKRRLLFQAVGSWRCCGGASVRAARCDAGHGRVGRHAGANVSSHRDEGCHAHAGGGHLGAGRTRRSGTASLRQGAQQTARAPLVAVAEGPQRSLRRCGLGRRDFRHGDGGGLRGAGSRLPLRGGSGGAPHGAQSPPGDVGWPSRAAGRLGGRARDAGADACARGADHLAVLGSVQLAEQAAERPRAARLRRLDRQSWEVAGGGACCVPVRARHAAAGHHSRAGDRPAGGGGGQRLGGLEAAAALPWRVRVGDGDARPAGCDREPGEPRSPVDHRRACALDGEYLEWLADLVAGRAEGHGWVDSRWRLGGGVGGGVVRSRWLLCGVAIFVCSLEDM